MDYTAFWCITSSFWLVIDSENCVGMLLWKEKEYGRSLNNKSIYLSDWKQQLKLRLKPTNLFSNMATQTQNVCPFNKFGYWKHKDMCRKLHINELCENTTCDFSSCKFRHPKTCKLYWEYRRCKSNPCAFKHTENINFAKNLNQES